MPPAPVHFEQQKAIFHAYLEQHGLKRTSQRDEILQILLSSRAHHTAEELYQKLRKRHKSIGVSTVYRTLKLLAECNLVREVRLSDDRACFEANYDVPHHDHLVCLRCRQTVEFHRPAIEEMQEQIACENDFVMTGHTLVIHGICPRCQKQDSRD